MMRSLLGVAVSTLIVLAPAAALGAPCDAPGHQRGEPIRVPGAPANIGTLPPACPDSEIFLTAGGAVAIAAENFYGSLFAGAAVEGRYRFSTLWISFRAPSLEYRFAANATIRSKSVDMGGWQRRPSPLHSGTGREPRPLCSGAAPHGDGLPARAPAGCGGGGCRRRGMLERTWRSPAVSRVAT